MAKPKAKKTNKEKPADTKSSGRALPAIPKQEAIGKLDSLQRYMQEVGRYPMLTPEEEDHFARHYQKFQDKESAQRLVLANLRLVVKIAMEYRSAFHNMLDLIQEGNIGLMRAVEKYDVEKSVRFSSYAAWWVRAYILKFIIDNYRLVKVGTTQAQKKLFFNLVKEKEKIEKLGFTPTPKLLSERLNVKEDEVREMEVRMGSREVELDAPRANYEGAKNLDFIPAGSENIQESLEQGELQDILLKNIEEFTQVLKTKEKQIFTERLFAEVPRTLQEIADEYDITRERIRQIEARVVDKMRTFFKDKGLDIDVKARDVD